MGTLGSGPSQDDDNSYLLPSAKANSEEQERLDAMHEGVTAFFGGRLTFADLGKPKRILEVGAGSGAWAIHAARDYPKAEVIAIDISPLPDRALPKNVTFLQMDVCQPLPFEHESFDVVHARFVLMHLPHFRDVLARMCVLIKPGGHLILEEIDARAYCERQETPEAVKFFHDRLENLASQRGQTQNVGHQLQPSVSKLGMFLDVTVKVLTIPFSPGWTGPVEVGALGDTMKQSLMKSSAMMVKIVPGFTEESVAKWKLALEDPEHELRIRVYFLAAQKSYKVPQTRNAEVIRRAPLPIRLGRRLSVVFLPLYWTGRGLSGVASWFVSLSRWR